MDKKQILVIALVALGSLFIAFFTFRFSPGDLEYDFISEDEVCVARQKGEHHPDHSGNTSWVRLIHSLMLAVYHIEDVVSGHVKIPSEVSFAGMKYKVTQIDDAAFLDCFDLQSVEIPNSVTSIGDEAFRACSNLQSVDIPNSVTSIGKWAFLSCSNLQSVEIPNSVTTIGAGAFKFCDKLQSLEIPNSVTTIGKGVFVGCQNLRSVVIPNSVTIIGNEAFSGCSSLNGVAIPNSVTSIGEYAFHGCANLQNVVIPNLITSIRKKTFSRCFNLQSVTINAQTPPTVREDVFTETSLQTIYVPATSVEKYKAAEGWKEYIKFIYPISNSD